MFFVQRQYTRHLIKINDLIKSQAKEKGLKIKKINYPTLKDWKNEPFDREIKIGTLGLYGFPTNEEYYRILECVDLNSDLHKTFWVKATTNPRSNTLTTEWREKN